MASDNQRLEVVDALRGFAILSIMLLHNIEHFDFIHMPEHLPAWIKTIDRGVWDTLFFLFGGKSYAIFALLFGVTFAIQDANYAKRGGDFRGRFAWRLVLLAGFGLVNSAFYQGDILMIYAVLGLSLIPVARLSNGVVFAIACALMLQPFLVVDALRALGDTRTTIPDPVSWSYFGQMGPYITGSSLVDTWWGNLTNGRTAVFLWTWENGRVPQACSLFMLGMLAGRLGLFAPSEKNLRFWRRVLIGGALVFTAFHFGTSHVTRTLSGPALKRAVETMMATWSNLAFMSVLTSGFVLLYQATRLTRVLQVLAPVGRMSLSNYLLQTLAGTALYYGFGLGLYQYTGATYCLGIGLALASLQIWFSHVWLKRHRQGPLETLWHKGTWVGVEKTAKQTGNAAG